DKFEAEIFMLAREHMLGDTLRLFAGTDYRDGSADSLDREDHLFFGKLGIDQCQYIIFYIVEFFPIEKEFFTIHDLFLNYSCRILGRKTGDRQFIIESIWITLWWRHTLFLELLFAFER